MASVVLVIAGWLWLGAPPPSLDLAALMPGEWEVVCDAHCYNGPIQLKGRTYATVSACHDTAWGLIFIDADGSHAAAAGHCRPNGLTVHLDRCLPRASATVQRLRDRGGCPHYGLRSGVPG